MTELLLAYLLGSVNGSLLLGRLRGVDIRTLGSGNAGGTNALRTQGKLFALGVVALDVSKGWLAAALLPQLALPGLARADGAAAAALPAACGLAAAVGHVYPVWHGFRGGKGAATLLGALAALAPALLAPVLATWLTLLMVFGFVGLATVVATAVVPLSVLLGGYEPREALLAFGLLAAAIVLYTHRANLARMRAGTEPRVRRLWLLRR